MAKRKTLDERAEEHVTNTWRFDREDDYKAGYRAGRRTGMVASRRLRKIVKKLAWKDYATHKFGCGTFQGWSCSCGLRTLLRSVIGSDVHKI